MGYTPNRRHSLNAQVRDHLEALLGLKQATGTITLDDAPADEDEIALPDGRTLTLLEAPAMTEGSPTDPLEVQIETTGTMAGVTSPLSAATDYALQDYLEADARVWYSPTKKLYIWWDGTDTWYMSAIVGLAGAGYWSRTDADPEGEFTHGGTATGDPTYSLADELADTLTNIIAAVNYGQDDPDDVLDPAGIWATEDDYGLGDPSLTITAGQPGVAGNVAITTTGAFTVAGMSGGCDGSAAASIDDEILSASATETAGNTEEVVAAPGEGYAIWVYGYWGSMNTLAGTWSLKSAATIKAQGDSLIGGTFGATGGGLPVFKCAENEALNFCPVTGAGKINAQYRVVEI